MCFDFKVKKPYYYVRFFSSFSLYLLLKGVKYKILFRIKKIILLRIVPLFLPGDYFINSPAKSPPENKLVVLWGGKERERGKEVERG